MSTNNFYCRNHSGSPDFDIDEWNEVREGLISSNISEKKSNEILFPKPCNKQCFDCIADVGETRINTQKLILKNKRKCQN